MTLEHIIFLAAFISVLCCLLYMKVGEAFAKPDNNPRVMPGISMKSIISRDYQDLRDRIRNAATKIELSCLECMVEEFEEEYRKSDMVNEMFIDLHNEIQMRYNVLYSKRVSA